MTIPYEKIGRKIYDILAAANYNVEMFDDQSNKTYDVETARKFFIVPGNSMVSIHDSDDDEKAKITVSLSPDVDIAVFEQNVGKALKHIAARYGQNMGYSVRKFGHELQPKDFAHQIKKVEEGSAMVNKTVSEAKVSMTGTTRSSYQKVGECKVIIRHTDRVNEDKFGARSRNINAIFVETKNGERFKVAENNLHGARAMARHLSNGGSPFDTVGIKVSSMMEEMSSLKNMMAEVRSISKDGQLVEQGNELAGKIRTRFIGLRETLRKMSGKVGYFRQTSDLTENKDLNEYTYDPEGEPESGTDKGPKDPGSYSSPAQELMFKMQDALSPPSQLDDAESNSWAKASESLGNVLADPDYNKLSNEDMRVLFDAARRLEINIGQSQTESMQLDEYVLPDGGKYDYVLKQYGYQIQGGGPVGGEVRYVGRKYEIVIKLHIFQKVLGWLLVNKDDLATPIAKGANAQSLNATLGKLTESVQENKNVDGEMEVEEKSVDTKSTPKEDEVPNMIQAPEYDRPTGKTKNHFVQDLVRDNSKGLHSVNYYEEGVAPEETMLEEWFDQMADVEFFKEEELIIEEDKAPRVEKILPHTALHTLNVYVGHPLFDRYVSLYEEQEIFDDVLSLVEENSKLWNTIAEARHRLTEFVWGDIDPQIIEDAVEKLKELKSERRTGMKDAIDQISQEISDGHLDGTAEAKEVVAKEIWKRADEEGLINHDFGGKFADAAMSNNEVIAGAKDEIEAERYYGPAKFGEADAPMDAGRSRYTATTPPDFGDRDGAPEELEPCRKCGDRHEGPCPLYDAEAGLRQVGDVEIQAIWEAPDVETKRQLSLELIKDFHFKDETSRRLEMNKLNAMVRPQQFNEWAKNMLLHGEGMGFGTGRGPQRRESIEHNSDLARISELAGIRKNDVEEDAASEKKLGRRKAGSYGRPGSKQQKQMASKSSRRAGKEDIKAALKKESFGAFPDPEDGDGDETGTYGRRMKPLPSHPDEEEEDFNAHTNESIATFDNMPLLLDKKQVESTNEPEISEDFSDEVTLDNMPLLLKQEEVEPTGEPEISEDGARIIQLARYRT